MSLFTSGDNGTFDNTVDPNGNPPSDWNITKASDAIVRFTDVNPITGTGSMHVESRTIFNDDYGFKRQANTAFDENQGLQDDDKNIQIFLSDIPNFDVTDNFKFIFDFYPTEFYDFGSQNIWNFLLDGNDYIRIVTSSSNNNKVDLNISINGVISSISHTETLNLNTLNTFEFDFIQGTSFSLTLNGVTITNNDAVSIVGNYTEIKASDVNYGGATNRPVRGVYGDTILESGGVKRYEFKFNQEQGSEVYESVTESFFDILNLYSPSELQFDGGAWVDTTTL